MIQRFLGILLLCSFSLSCGGANHASQEGLVFAKTSVDVGEPWAGEVLQLEFPFSVNKCDIRIDSALPTCGCLSFLIWVEGQPYDYGELIPAGSSGVVKVVYNTIGFRGRKFTQIDFQGSGVGLPAQVEVRSWLRSWFELEPRVAQFGVIDGSSDQVMKIKVTGQQPFRITEIRSQTPPMYVRGVPSESANIEQTIELVVPATTEEGRRAGFFHFLTDQGNYSFSLGAGYEVAGELWTIPDQRLLLGQLAQGVEHFAVIDIGVRRGQLGEPTVSLKDLPGATVRVEKLVAAGRYRIHLGLTPQAARIAGEVQLSLPYSVDGHNETVDRRIQVFGVAKTP